MLGFNYSAIQAGRIVMQQTCRFVLMLILLEPFSIFGRTKFIINFNKVHYKISDDGGLLSGWSFVRTPGLIPFADVHFNKTLVLVAAPAQILTMSRRRPLTRSVAVLSHYSSQSSWNNRHGERTELGRRLTSTGRPSSSETQPGGIVTSTD